MRCVVSVVAMLGLVACTASPSGPDHWRRACEHFNALPHDEGVQQPVAECVTALGDWPPAIADDLARCILELQTVDSDGDASRECWRPETRAYIDQIDQAQRALDDLVAAVHDYEKEHRRLPASLAELPGEPKLSDHWGRAYRFTPEEEAQITSAGPDRRFDTADDLTARADFIYFQF